MKFIRYIYLFIFFVLCNSHLYAQVSPTDTSKSLEIVEAETFINEIKGPKDYKFLYGNVLLKHDSILFYSDTTILIDMVDLESYGDVIIRQGDSLNIFSRELLYNSNDKLAVLRKEVVLENGERKLFLDTLYYNVETKIGSYDSGALLTDDEAQLRSIRGEYHVKTEMVYFYDSVSIVHPEFELITDSLQYDMRRNIAYFLGPTLINQNGAQIYTESGFYDIENQRAEFNKNPQYVEDSKILLSEKMRYEGSENKIYIEENVIYKSEDKRIDSDLIIYDDSTKIADVIGNVRYRSNESEMKGDIVKYDTENDQIITDGRTIIVDGSRTISSKHIDFNNKTGRGTARDHVSIKDTLEGYEIISDDIEFDREEKSAITHGGRPLIILGKSGEELLYISANKIWTYESINIIDSSQNLRDTVRYLIADDSVRIYSETIQGIADSLTFDGTDSTFTLYQQPILWTDTIQYKADTLTAQMKNNEINYLGMSLNATIIATPDSLFYDQIGGTYIEGFFDENGEIEKVKIDGNAETVIYVRNEDREYSGVDKASSAFIHVLFEEGELSGIKYFDDYTAEVLPMLTTDHKSIRIKKFNWVIDRKPTSVEDLEYSQNIQELVQQHLLLANGRTPADSNQVITDYDSDNLMVRQISPHTYVHTSYLKTETFGTVPCNGLLIQDKDKIIVIDTPVDSLSSQELINYIQDNLNKKIELIIPTHFHIDCLGGLEIFHENGIPSLAYDKTKELAYAHQKAIPQSTFSESSQSLTLDSLEYELYYFGPGHTQDNIVVYIPKDKVLFGGCLVKEIGAGKGNLEDANPNEWSKTIRSIKDTLLQIEIVVPGHGEIGDTRLLDYTEKLFSE